MKKIMSLALACMMLSSVSFSTSALATEDANAVISSNAVDMACGALKSALDEYYVVSDVSGEVKTFEVVSGGVNVVALVDYSTEIRAETVDDVPYIKGILAAMEDLTDSEEIQRANDYLTIWRGEIERDHIGKVQPHSAEISVFIPTNINARGSQITWQNMDVNNAEIQLRTYVEGVEATSETAYIEMPISSFVPSDDEVMENAKNDVLSILSESHMSAQATRSSNSRAKELIRTDAASYAKDPNNFPAGTKPDGTKYKNYDSDCANFVSQCYSAGHVKEDATWTPYSGAWRYTGGPRKAEDHYGVCDYMVDEEIVFEAGTGVWTRAFAGTIIYYPKSLTTQAHVGIVTSNDGRNAYYSAHTNDHCNQPMKNMQNVLSYYIPVWDSYTKTWTPQ